jgi:hypothetical protein
MLQGEAVCDTFVSVAEPRAKMKVCPLSLLKKGTNLRRWVEANSECVKREGSETAEGAKHERAES